MKPEVYQNNIENPSVCHRKHSMSIAKTDWLVLFRKVIAVFLTVIIKIEIHLGTKCRVKEGNANSNLCALNS